jgi:hypothetical protein
VSLGTKVMNYQKHNSDLRILQAEAGRPRFGLAPGWTRVDWKPNLGGGNMIYLRAMALPPTCSLRRSDVRIEAPASLYDPTADGRLQFYRNVWIADSILLFDPRSRQWLPMPRLHSADANGFAYLCIHPDPVSPDRNVLDFIRAMDLFFLNPGYKSAPGERL